MSTIRVAREFCFQYFFHLQLPVFQSLKADYCSGESSSLKDSVEVFKETTNTLLDDKLNDFVFAQISGTLQNYEEIEKIVKNNLNNWKLERLSKVDHTNLMLSVHELCFSKYAPATVVINEAIEISKKFGTIESSSFINGVLDNISKS